jgi:hypothetical protein
LSLNEKENLKFYKIVSHMNSYFVIPDWIGVNTELSRSPIQKYPILLILYKKVYILQCLQFTVYVLIDCIFGVLKKFIVYEFVRVFL